MRRQLEKAYRSLTNVSHRNIFTKRVLFGLAPGVPPGRTFSYIELGKRRSTTVIAPTHHAIISLIAGILILIIITLLNHIVAMYLIIIGFLCATECLKNHYKEIL